MAIKTASQVSRVGDDGGWTTLGVRETRAELEAWAARLTKQFPPDAYTTRIDERPDGLLELQVRQSR